MNRQRVTPWSELRRIWIGPVLGLAGMAALCLIVSFSYDFAYNRPPGAEDLTPLGLLFNYDMETLQNALGNVAQMVAAVVGIVITVVAIIVQLAATRYTPRVTDLFLKERTNIVILGFFVIACVFTVWVSMTVGNGFLPRASVIAAVLVATASLILMVPYFAWVFDFLDPERVVARIQEQALGHASNPGRDITRSQELVLEAVEVLADVATAAVSAQDKLISARAVDALRVLMVHYTERKSALPEGWHEPGQTIRENPDFVAMHADALQDLVRDRLWLEWKVLRQFQGIYNEALDDSPDMNYLLAIDTRYLGEAALLAGDEASLRLVIKFFNTACGRPSTRSRSEPPTTSSTSTASWSRRRSGPGGMTWPPRSLATCATTG